MSARAHDERRRKCKRETERTPPGSRGVNNLRFAVAMTALAPVLLVGGAVRYLALRARCGMGAGVTVLFHKILCAALGVRVRAFGHLPRARTALIAANHVSWLDIPVLGSLQPVAFLAKKEVGRHWLGRALVGLQGGVFIDRRRRRCIPTVNRQIAQTLAGGGPVALFAEATTGDGNRLLRCRSSHFEALREAPGGSDYNSLVQPVFIDYISRNGLPLGRVGQPLVAWYGDMTFAGHLWRFLRDGPFDCEISFGEPIPFLKTSNRKEIALQAQGSVRELAERQRRHRLRWEAPPVRTAPCVADFRTAEESVV